MHSSGIKTERGQGECTMAELFLVKKNNFTTTAETIKCSDIKTDLVTKNKLIKGGSTSDSITV